MPKPTPQLPEPVPAPPRAQFSLATFLSFLGPGFLVSVAFVDPGNLEVDLQAGALYGYKLTWVILVSTVFALVLQALAVKLSLVTERSLAVHFYEQYPFLQRTGLFFMAMMATIAFDVAEVIGTAIGLEILFNIPLPLGIVISFFDTLLILVLQAWGMRKLEAVVESLLLTISVCFVIELGLSRPSPAELLKSALVPEIPTPAAALLAVSIFGSIIMPHNLFLHSSIVLPRRNPSWTPSQLASAIVYSSAETGVALFLSLLINVALLGVAAAKLYGSKGVGSEEDPPGLSDAAVLLQNLLGSEVARTAWGVALLAAGHSATVTGTLASQIICEGFFGLQSAGRQVRSSVLVNTLTRGLAMGPAVAAALVGGEAGADALVVGAQVAVALTLPFTVVPLLKFVSSTKIMGTDFCVGGWMLAAGWVVAAAAVVANGVGVVSTVGEWRSGWSGGAGMWGWVLMAGGAGLLGGYLWLLWYVFAKVIVDVRDGKLDRMGDVNGLESSPLLS